MKLGLERKATTGRPESELSVFHVLLRFRVYGLYGTSALLASCNTRPIKPSKPLPLYLALNLSGP